MLEFWDNLIQLLINIICGITAWFWYAKRCKQPYFILACFYSCLALGLLYWTIYLRLCGTSPRIFYVSNISWSSSYIFLGILTYLLIDKSEKRARLSLPTLLALAVSAVFFIIFVINGDYVLSFVDCSLLTIPLCYALRGIANNTRVARKRIFDIAVVAFVLAEYLLWTSSCYFGGKNFSNSYFILDIILTLTMLGICVTARKAVEE